MRSQAMGLAKAIKAQLAETESCEIIEKTVKLKSWGKLLPGHLNPLPFHTLSKDSSSFNDEIWPDIIITCGRRSSAISIAIGRKSNGKSYRVHVQNPQIPTSYFDLIVSMQHDALRGPNVIETNTALHKLNRQTLEQEGAHWRSIWHSKNLLPSKAIHQDEQPPILGVSLGGKNKKFGFDETSLSNLIDCLENARKTHSATILLTPSSRTEPFVKTALNSHFKSDDKVWIWDQEGENPYFGILANADHLLITADSVSMISEGLFTGAPVHIFPLKGTGRRHKIFLENLKSDNLIHHTDKMIDFSVKGSKEPIDETAKVAQIILQNIKDL